ncbi:unnamed protein product [Toxocara canis]|uniref:Mediator of RNA polymerase II transcription subunit 8 n=1 Tax=Toxocara canis TaxID=6265 RepID=A0A183UX35_TOXCA|nr:unnamed protein product [Toxocara canis]
MNAQVSTAFGHQEDPEKFAQAVAHIESKAVDVKSNIEQLLFMLDLQHKVPWPDMLDKFSSLASAMGQLQTVLRKSALPSGIEDFGKLLRKHLLVPHTLSNQIDPDLQQATQNRVHCWNHDVAPDYLRTKPNPEVEADEMQLDNEKNSRTFDQVNKQIAAMNKHLESLLNSLADNARSQADAHVDVPIYNNQDTQKLVRAVINGEGLRPTRGGVSAENASQAGSTSASSLPAGTHVPARTAASVMPQQQQQRR